MMYKSQAIIQVWNDVFRNARALERTNYRLAIARIGECEEYRAKAIN